jgi:hypothetical protein
MARRERSGFSKFVKWVWFALTAAAVYSELQKPAEEREWHGELAGVIPYDFRIPTPERARERLWDPYGSFMNEQVFGLGWTLNFGRLWRELQERTGNDRDGLRG